MDACCGPAATAAEASETDSGRFEWRTIAAAVAAASWVAGVVAEVADAGSVATVAFVVAIV
ncbi:MAG TPA: hypothetical protein PLP95_08955, partial [Microthrixaceae bacterium]|nr:hypothetical protein [Microthrixaceae bacterium]